VAGYCWVIGSLPVEDALLRVEIVTVESDEYRGKPQVRNYTTAKRIIEVTTGESVRIRKAL